MSGQRQTTESLPGGRAQGEGGNNGGGGADMSVEARAKRLGWWPKEKFHGHPDDWVDAETYVNRAETEFPILKENFRKLDERAAKSDAANTALQRQLGQMNNRLVEMGEAFDAMRDLSTKAESRGYERAMIAIKAKAAKAAEDGDAAAVQVAMDEAQQLIETRVKPADKPVKDDKKADDPPKQQPQGDPVANAWAMAPERAWYRENRRMQGYANATFDEIHAGNPTMPMAEKLAKVDREVRSQFKTYFERSQSQNGRDRSDRDAAVNEPREPEERRSGNGRSFDDLPPAAKKQYAVTAAEVERRYKGKPNYKPYSKDEFAKIYFGPEPAEE